MAGDWIETTLGEITLWASGGTPSKNDPSYWNGNIPWISASSMKTIRLADSEVRITESGLQNGSRLAESNSVLLLVRGSELHKRIPIGIAVKSVAFNQDVKALRAKPGTDSEYLLYWLLANERLLLSKVEHTGIGAGKLDTDVIKGLPVLLPPPEEQRTIARYLSVFDDKIELNRQISETLEGMIRILFKSWFVDFDPVRTKADGRGSGLSAPIAALFPESFECSEVGEVPRGWRIGVLDDLTEFVLGGDWGKDAATEEISELALCIRGADIPELQAGGFGKMPMRFLKKSSLTKRQLQDGDLVIEISGGSPTQSTGRPVLISEALLSRRGYPLVCSNFCRLLRLKNVAASKFVYAWLRWLYDNNELLQFENGTTGIKNFAFTLFSSSFRMVIPPPEVLRAFDSLTLYLFRQQQLCASENETLVALRDTLLSKLISGELRLPNAERPVGGQH